MKTHTIWRSGLLSAALCTVVLTALPWLQGCFLLPPEGCSKPPATGLYMTAEDSAAVPYRGGETLRYQRSINGVIKDTLVFESVSAREVVEEGEGCCCEGDCSSNAIFHHPEWVYQTADGEEELKFRLELSAWECTGGLPERQKPAIQIFSFGEYWQQILMTRLTSEPAVAFVTYYPVIVINQISYNDVWLVKGSDYISHYSKKYGFISVENEDYTFKITLL